MEEVTTRLDVEKSDVFVSWTSKDRELKNKILEYLKSKELKCLDADESCCGDFVKWSKAAAKDASVFVLILTENTVDKILKDKQENRPNYVLEEVHTALQEWGADAVNRIIVICQDDGVYNHRVLWENLQGVSEGNLLRREHLSVIYGTELTGGKLEELSRKVINLIIHRFIHKYNAAMAANDIELVPLYKKLQKSPDKQVSFDNLYVSRTITEIGANGETLAEIDSPKELVACGDILFLSGPGGSGKTQYLNQLFKSIDTDTVMIALPCFKIANSEKPLFENMYRYFYEKCGYRDFFSVENFRSLLSEKKLLLVLDGMDEIPTEEAVRKLLKKISAFYEPDSENITLLFTGRNEKDAEYITFKRKTVRKFRLNKLSDEGIKELGNKLFLMFGDEDKGNEFYVRVKDLDDEIKSNALLLSQLAIVYEDSGDVPRTIVGIFDAVSAIMINCDKNKEFIDIPQGWKKERIEDLSSLLVDFAAERYKCISQGKTLTALRIFRKVLQSKYNDDSESHAEFLLEYIKSRSFYIEDNDGNGEFYHKMFSEYFTAVYYYKKAFDDCSDNYSIIKDKSAVSELFGHYSDSYWAKVLQLFLMKADSCIDKETTDKLYKLILSENKIEEYTLLFDCCRDLIVHMQEAQTLLVCDILQKSADGVYPPYGPLFWYVPEYGLYESALLAASCMKGNAKALALVRDVCYIYGQKNSIDAITDKISGQELFDAASPKLGGVRRALCEIFYLGDTKYEGGKDIYPRCFNVAETLSFRDYSCGLSGRMKTPFQDELGLYSHTSYNILNGGPIGLVSCPYDAAEMEKKLSGIESFKLRGLILSPTEKERFGFVNFTRVNVQVLYLPENVSGTDKGFNRYMPLICDVCVNEGGVSYLFGDVMLSLLYPIVDFSGCRTVKSVVIAEGVEDIENSAFYGGRSLRAIKIPEGVKKIGRSAFAGCSSLQEVKIPEGVKEIGVEAFADCSSLQKIEIPQGAEYIGVSAFKDCSNLKEAKIPEGVKEIGSVRYERGCSSLEKLGLPGICYEVLIPESRGLSQDVFSGCSSLQEIIIPEGVNEIHEGAFKGCSSLKEIVIPQSVIDIGDNAFKGCTGLESVVISINFKNDIQRIFWDIDSKIIHFR